jgi:hypothetical protein
MSDLKMCRVDTPFNKTAILICAKCSEKSEALRAELKPVLKEKFGRSVRCMTSSCQGLCPENKIAITKITQAESEVFKSFEVSTDLTAQELIDAFF